MNTQSKQRKLIHLVTDLGLTSETFISQTIEIFSKLNNIEYHVIYQTSHSYEFLSNVNYHQIDFAKLTGTKNRIAYKFSSDYSKFNILFNEASKKLLNIVKTISPDVLYADYGSNAIFGLEACKTLGLPLVVHLHGADITSKLNDNNYAKQLAKVFNYRNVTVIAASQHIKRLAVLFGCPENVIHVINLGLDFKKLTAYRTVTKTPYPSLVFLGRMTEKKHPLALVQAFYLVVKHCPRAKLTLIGGGELLEKVNERVSELGLTSCVNVTGALKNHDALQLMSSHWVYAQHSVTASNGDQEGFGISMAEAAAMEMPVVATWHNGIPEQVIHEETGLLCHEFNYEEMADYIITLFNDAELRDCLGKAGKLNIEALCALDKREEKLHTLIKSTIIS